MCFAVVVVVGPVVACFSSLLHAVVHRASMKLHASTPSIPPGTEILIRRGGGKENSYFNLTFLARSRIELRRIQGIAAEFQIHPCCYFSGFTWVSSRAKTTSSFLFLVDERDVFFFLGQFRDALRGNFWLRCSVEGFLRTKNAGLR